MKEPRCFQCGHILDDINAACPVCLPGFYEANARIVPRIKAWVPGDDRCDRCDNGILSDWHFCAYCGYRIERVTVPVSDPGKVQGRE